MDVSAIVVSFNTRELLRACLGSVRDDLARAGCSGEVMVVDNCSADASPEMVRAEFPEAHLIENTTNRGFASANNQALSLAQGRYFLFINPDAEVTPGAIRSLVDFLDSHPRAAVVSPRLLNPDGTLQQACFRFPTLPMVFLDFFPLSPRLLESPANGRYRQAADSSREFPIDHPLGACFLVRREALDRVGPFDEGFFMYCEEVDLCFRLWKAGWEVYHLPEARVIHHGGQSARQMAARMYVELYRSRYRLFAKHYSPAFAATARQVTRAGALYAALKAIIGCRRDRISRSERDERLAACVRVVRL